MRDIDCRSLLRLQENFATRSKPQVQTTVAASCLTTISPYVKDTIRRFQSLLRRLRTYTYILKNRKNYT